MAMADRAESRDTVDSGAAPSRSQWVAVGAVWAVVTALALGFSYLLNLPDPFGREAHIADEAFKLLMYLASPVFGLVVAVLVVSVVAYRYRPTEASASGKRGEAESGIVDGAHIVATPKVDAAWLAITAALAVLLIINPGIVGIVRFFGTTLPDEQVVKVEGARWFWTVTYPDAGVTTTKELVLPTHRRTRIEVSSKDVLHSFWIPGLRVKIDAVPGRTTTISTTPEKEGSFETDQGLRLQCAELCGLAHSSMAIPVRLLPPDEFDRWLSEQKAPQG